MTRNEAALETAGCAVSHMRTDRQYHLSAAQASESDFITASNGDNQQKQRTEPGGHVKLKNETILL